jgi:hypothetical protein
MGIDWWESDASLSSGAPSSKGSLEAENRELRERLERLERQLGVGNGEAPESSQRGTRSSRG